MGNITETKITSGEIGLLWMHYVMRSLFKQMAGFFASKSMEQQAKDILTNYSNEVDIYNNMIKEIFDKEKAVIPEGFTEKDVFSDAPSLFDDIFHIMWLRIMAKIMMGFSALHLSMSFRKDVRDYFVESVDFTKDLYNETTEYLTQQGVLARPPYVTMPKQIEYIEEKKYMSGFQTLRNKRALNTIEISYLFTINETNVFGIQLTTGFAQVAKEKEVKDYFVRGKELAKKVVSTVSSLILDSDILPPATWAGKATDSIVSPFSDKLMMFLMNIMSSSAIAGNAAGMAFSMRSDLPAKLAVITLDTQMYAREGGKIMIKHKWLEEPPQMEDRNELIRAMQ